MIATKHVMTTGVVQEEYIIIIQPRLTKSGIKILKNVILFFIFQILFFYFLFFLLYNICFQVNLIEILAENSSDTL